MNNYEQELLELYRKNAALEEQLKESDTANIQKITAISDAVDELNNIIAKHRPSEAVCYDLDQVAANLEILIR